jgi:D-erythro-7,8-dihydroneopterin triphosphate epimerase
VKLATVKIKDLRLRCVIGMNESEREKRQDVTINVEFDFDARGAVDTDDGSLTVDYKTVTKRIISAVEASSFHLLESLADHVMELVLQSEGVSRVVVEVDKPHAIRFADSVSVSFSCEADTQA